MARKNDPGSDLIDTDAAAGLIGCDPRTVRRHAAAGRLPAVALGRDWLFRRADVLAFRPPTPGGRRGRPRNPA